MKRPFFRRLKHKIRRYIHRYGYNPLRAIVRERERMKFIHLGMRLARAQAPRPAIVPLQQAAKPEVLHLPTLAWTKQYKQQQIAGTDTTHVEAINAETARQLQEHLDKQQPHYEPPAQNTEPHRFQHFGRINLQPISTEEMPIAFKGEFKTADTDRWAL